MANPGVLPIWAAGAGAFFTFRPSPDRRSKHSLAHENTNTDASARRFLNTTHGLGLLVKRQIAHSRAPRPKNRGAPISRLAQDHQPRVFRGIISSIHVFQIRCRAPSRIASSRPRTEVDRSRFHILKNRSVVQADARARQTCHQTLTVVDLHPADLARQAQAAPLARITAVQRPAVTTISTVVGPPKGERLVLKRR